MACNGKPKNCASKEHVGYQPMPSSGLLAKNLDLSLVELEDKIGQLKERPVYVYVLTTVEAQPGSNKFLQLGSAPNFQGDRITLCTCKHKDRSSLPKYRRPNSLNPWKEVWVAGICSAIKWNPRPLFYLMLIEEIFEDHNAIWAALPHPKAKSASRDPFGDVYEPIHSKIRQADAYLNASYKPSYYKSDTDCHVHDANARKKDIEKQYYNRRPKLLLGDPCYSYLWSAPKIMLKAKANQDWSSAHHKFFQSLEEFFSNLQ